MEQKQFTRTARREDAFYRLGDQALPKLLAVHDNASSSALRDFAGQKAEAGV